MSNYGFVTYNEKTGKKEVSINSKYPVFGPEYNKINSTFRTTHISDTKTYPIKTASISIPTPNLPYYGIDNYYGISEYVGYDDELVTEYEHGYKFRPIGYATITGKIIGNNVGELSQTVISGTMSYGGNFTVYSNTRWLDTELTPGFGGMNSQTGGFYLPWERNSMTVGNSQYTGNFIVPDSVLGVFLSRYNVNATIGIRQGLPGTISAPYWVEIDDTKVKIWKRIYWADHIIRAKPSDYDAYERGKVRENFAGSELDITVYLCPYKLGDLI